MEWPNSHPPASVLGVPGGYHREQIRGAKLDAEAAFTSPGLQSAPCRTLSTNGAPGGLAVARRAGHQLLAADRGRAWRRIMVLALEDIGIGDTATAAALVGVSTDRPTREQLGGDAAALGRH